MAGQLFVAPSARRDFQPLMRRNQRHVRPDDVDLRCAADSRDRDRVMPCWARSLLGCRLPLAARLPIGFALSVLV
jgi:hypothetical protein